MAVAPLVLRGYTVTHLIIVAEHKHGNAGNQGTQPLDEHLRELGLVLVRQCRKEVPPQEIEQHTASLQDPQSPSCTGSQTKVGTKTIHGSFVRASSVPTGLETLKRKTKTRASLRTTHTENAAASLIAVPDSSGAQSERHHSGKLCFGTAIGVVFNPVRHCQLQVMKRRFMSDCM